MKTDQANPHPYVGMWVTADGYIRHELLPNGRSSAYRYKRIDVIVNNAGVMPLSQLEAL